MICKKCGNQIPDTMAFCGFCGAAQQVQPQKVSMEGAPVPQMQYQPVQPQYQPVVPPPPPPKKNNTVLIAVIASLLVIVAVLVGIFVIKPALDDEDTTKSQETTASSSEKTTEGKTESPTKGNTPPNVDCDVDSAEDALTGFFDIIYNPDSEDFIYLMTGQKNLDNVEYNLYLSTLVMAMSVIDRNYSVSSYDVVDSNKCTFKLKLELSDPEDARDLFEDCLDYYGSNYTLTDADGELKEDVLNDVLDCLENAKSKYVTVTIDMCYNSSKGWYPETEDIEDFAYQVGYNFGAAFSDVMNF